MTTLDRERLQRRREMWRAYRERGELPDVPAAERTAAARRHRRTYWWIDLEEEEEGGRPPPENAASTLPGVLGVRRCRGFVRHSITTQPTPGAMAVAA